MAVLILHKHIKHVSVKRTNEGWAFKESFSRIPVVRQTTAIVPTPPKGGKREFPFGPIPPSCNWESERRGVEKEPRKGSWRGGFSHSDFAGRIKQVLNQGRTMASPSEKRRGRPGGGSQKTRRRDSGKEAALGVPAPLHMIAPSKLTPGHWKEGLPR